MITSAGENDPQVPQGPRTFRARQALDWLTRRFGRTARAFAVIFFREVATYLAAPDAPRRVRARDAVATAIADQQPHLVIAHSLGSVVAYEALWAQFRSARRATAHLG